MKSLTLSFNLVLTLALLIGASFFMGVVEVEAKQVSWSTNSVPDLQYFSNDGRLDGLCSNVLCSWWSALKNTDVSVSYSADVYDQVSGTQIADGATIAIGVQLEFRPKVLADTDIYWFGTGYTADSPYGHWVTGAGVPPASSGVNACNAADTSAVTNIAQTDGMTGVVTLGTFTSFVPFSVSPPGITYVQSGTAILSCNAAGNLCTVTSSGSINASITFEATDGKFYYRWLSSFSNSTGCVYNNVPMSSGPEVYSGQNLTTHPPYILNVPAQSINFTLTAVGGNSLPDVPTITGTTTGTTNISYLFNFTATDPDNDTFRYEIDWDNNGTADEVTTYVPSGTTATVNHTWGTTGTKDFRARALDDQGGYSAWSTPHTITLSVPPAATNPTITPALLDFGSVSISSSKTMQFTITGGTVQSNGSVAGLAAPYSCTAGCSYNLNDGETQVVDITYTPVAAGTQIDTTIFLDSIGIFRPVTGVGVAPPTIDIVVDAIECANESDLPNWPLTSPNVFSNTASDFVAANPNCSFASGWSFQWGNIQPGGGTVSSQNSGLYSAPWTTFGPTNGSGRTQVSLTNTDLGAATKFYMHAAQRSGYIQFNVPFDIVDTQRPEFTCHVDNLFYDSHEWIDAPTPGNTYYCILITALEPLPDLISQNLAETSANPTEEGQALTFTAEAANIGAASTGVSFSDVFEYRYGNSGPFTNFATEVNLALNAAGTDTDSTTFTIGLGTSGQELWVQHCIDSTGAITEADESVAGNCSQVNLGIISAPPPDPTGFITFSPALCSVTIGNSACLGNSNWGVIDPNLVAITSVELDGIAFSSSISGSNNPHALPLGSSVFTLIHDGIQLASYTMNVGCVPGAAPSGGICVSLPIIDVIPVDALIRSGNTADVDITVTANYDALCTMQGAVTGSFTHFVAGGITQTTSQTTSPLTSATIVLVTCVGTADPALTSTQEARVEVVPTYQEI